MSRSPDRIAYVGNIALVVLQGCQASLVISEPELKIAFHRKTAPAVAIMPMFAAAGTLHLYCLALRASSWPRGHCHFEDADEGRP